MVWLLLLADTTLWWWWRCRTPSTNCRGSCPPSASPRPGNHDLPPPVLLGWLWVVSHCTHFALALTLWFLPARHKLEGVLWLVAYECLWVNNWPLYCNFVSVVLEDLVSYVQEGPGILGSHIILQRWICVLGKNAIMHQSLVCSLDLLSFLLKAELDLKSLLPSGSVCVSEKH